MRQPFQYLTRRRKNFKVDKEAAGAGPTLTAMDEYHRYHAPQLSRRGRTSPKLTIVSGV